jgi:hypothetical protein
MVERVIRTPKEGRGRAARIRASAQQKSTGPRTLEEKATMAGNTRRHGVTGRPDRERVALWLAVILDRPEITPADLMSEEEFGNRPPALAEAEARLISADMALRGFEAGTAKPIKTWRHSELTSEHILGMLNRDDVTKNEIEAGLSFLKQIDEPSVLEARKSGDQHGRLQRSLQAARAKRRSAFEVWAHCRSQVRAPTSTPNVQLPKTKPAFEYRLYFSDRSL